MRAWCPDAWATATQASRRTRPSLRRTACWCSPSATTGSSKLCAACDLPETALDPRFVTNEQRVANREALHGLLSQQLVTHSANHWFRLLMAKGVPSGPINTIAEGFALAAELGLDPVVQLPTDDPAVDLTLRGVATVANPIRLSATPVTYRSAPPRLGQHNGGDLGSQQSEGPAQDLGPGRSAAGVSS